MYELSYDISRSMANDIDVLQVGFGESSERVIEQVHRGLQNLGVSREPSGVDRRSSDQFALIHIQGDNRDDDAVVRDACSVAQDFVRHAG